MQDNQNCTRVEIESSRIDDMQQQEEPLTIDDEHNRALMEMSVGQDESPSKERIFCESKIQWFHIFLLLIFSSMIFVITFHSYVKGNKTNQFIENKSVKSLESEQISYRYNDNNNPRYRTSSKHKFDPPEDIGHMNVYFRKSSRSKSNKPWNRHRFPVARYNSNRFPLTGPFISFMPRIPIFVERITRQTILYSPIGVYIIPPVINMYGKIFSVGELIANGYASLVSSGGSINALDMGSLFRPIPLIGLNIPSISPMTGGFTGGIRSKHYWSSMPKLRETYVDDFNSNPSQYDDYEQQSKYSPTKSKSPYYVKERKVIHNRFKSIVIFGDSLSDTGNNYNLTNHTWPIVPPFYRGRFCDDRNWVDRLEKSYILNSAYGSATTDNNFVQGYTKFDRSVPVPGIRQQIAMYLNNNQISHQNFSDTLFIIWASGNDLIFKPTATPIAIVNSLFNGIKDLVVSGAKHILLFNIIPVQAFPFIRVLNQEVLFTLITSVANNALMTNIEAIQQNNTNLSLYIFDIHKLLTNLLSNDSTIFKDKVNNCWNVYNATYVQILCQNLKEHIFLDYFHVTSPVHQLIADAIKPFLSYQFLLNTNDTYIHTV